MNQQISAQRRLCGYVKNGMALPKGWAMPFSIVIKEVPTMGVFSEINLMMREHPETV